MDQTNEGSPFLPEDRERELISETHYSYGAVFHSHCKQSRIRESY